MADGTRRFTYLTINDGVNNAPFNDAAGQRQVAGCSACWAEIQMLVSTSSCPQVHQAIVNLGVSFVLNLDSKSFSNGVGEFGTWQGAGYRAANGSEEC